MHHLAWEAVQHEEALLQVVLEPPSAKQRKPRMTTMKRRAATLAARAIGVEVVEETVAVEVHLAT